MNEVDKELDTTAQQLLSAARLIGGRAAGTVAVFFLLCVVGACFAIAFGGRWRPADPLGLEPVVLAGAVIALLAAIPASWRPMVSASYGGAVVTIAWITAIQQNFTTTEEAAQSSMAWIYCTIFMSVVWVLILRPIATQEKDRAERVRRIRESDQLVDAITHNVVRILDQRSGRSLPPTFAVMRGDGGIGND